MTLEQFHARHADDPYQGHRAPSPLSDERMQEECGLFGIYYPGEDVANLTYFGLYALQHRGQELAGIGVSDGERMQMVKEMGLVSQVFDQEALDNLHGHIAIGHTRYSTTGSTRLPNAQPMLFKHPTVGPFLLAHNGNLVNAAELREELRAQEVQFETTSDTEVLGLLLARTPGETFDQVLAAALPRAEGAYCLLFLTRDSMVAARDPLGIRPMVLGRFGDVDAPGGTGYVITSETCALDVVGASFVLDVEPGEIVTVDASGMRSTKIRRAQTKRAMCSFEFIYFARPDSVMMDKSLYEARGNMGRELAREAPADADIVITVPDSATPAAIGFANESGLPFVEGMIKSRYITRTFIQPSQKLRESGIRLKFNPMKHVLEGKRVVLVDDFDRARQHVAADRRGAAPRGGEGGAHAHRLAADHVALLHGHRHRLAERAHRRAQQRGGGGPAAGDRLAALPEHRRPAPRDGAAERRGVLLCVLQRELPGGRAAGT